MCVDREVCRGLAACGPWLAWTAGEYQQVRSRVVRLSFWEWDVVVAKQIKKHSRNLDSLQYHEHLPPSVGSGLSSAC